MIARVVVPPGLAAAAWQSGLESMGDQMNLDIKVSAISDQ